MPETLNPDEIAARLASDEPDQRDRATRSIHSARAWDLIPPLVVGALRDVAPAVPTAAVLLLLSRDPSDVE